MTLRAEVFALLAALLVFFLICGAGLFIAAAGGQVWGTFDAGMMALVTIIIAAFVAVFTFVGMWKWLSDL